MRDQAENLRKPPSKKTSTHLDSLVNAIRSCGISFSVWEKGNADGKGSGLYDFSSLMGSDKKTLLKLLPPKLEDIIGQQTSRTVVTLWKIFQFMSGDVANGQKKFTVLVVPRQIIFIL